MRVEIWGRSKLGYCKSFSLLKFGRNLDNIKFVNWPSHRFYVTKSFIERQFFIKLNFVELLEMRSCLCPWELKNYLRP